MQITHGIISLCLILAAIATALGAVLPKSLMFGVLYILVLVLCSAAIVYSYCAKCPCRRLGCSHSVFGWLAVKFIRRKEGPYTFFDIAVTMISIAAILLIPQLWLIESLPALLLFWVLMALAGLEIVFLVCPDCSNRYCMFNRKNKFPERFK
jgi:hypothetical protein